MVDAAQAEKRWHTRLIELRTTTNKALGRRELRRSSSTLSEIEQLNAATQRCAALCARLELLVREISTLAGKAGLDFTAISKVIREDIITPIQAGRRASVPLLGNVADALVCTHLPGHPDQLYDLDKKIGEGAFGQVRKARHRQSSQDHAIKAVPKQNVTPDELWREIGIVRRLDHPHIMRLYHTFEDKETIYMASELCSGGSFFDALNKVGNLPEVCASYLFKQIASVVDYLHSRKICHRDIKPENFLIGKEIDLKKAALKLIDFGTAKRYDMQQLVTKVCTPHYVAPELLTKDSVPYTEKVDVWSCGVMLFQMLSGLLPFEHSNELQVLKRVKKGKYEFEPREVWGEISQDAREFVQSLLCIDVQRRSTAAEASQHQWLQSSKWTGALDPSMVREMTAQMQKFSRSNRLKRIALILIARQTDDESIQRLRNVFVSMDVDNNGTLGAAEIEDAVTDVVGESESADILEAIGCLDPFDAGSIPYTRFLAATINKSVYMNEDNCKAAFFELDCDKDGILSREDISRLLSDDSLVKTLPELIKEVETILDEVDTNRDGGVNFEEFMDLMRQESSSDESEKGLEGT